MGFESFLPKGNHIAHPLGHQSPSFFGTRDQFQGRQFFHGLGAGRNRVVDGFGMIQVHYIY